jgi:RND family efflux transporter MFP subunit
MRARPWLTVLSVMLLAGAGGALVTYRYLQTEGPVGGRPAAGARPTAPPVIAASPPTIRTFSLRIPWVGLVQSQASVELTALVPGRVEAIEAKDQMPIEGGAAVMRLGGSRIESRRAQLQAGVSSLKSQLALAGQTVKRLQQNLKEQLATKDQLAAAQETEIKLRTRLHEAQSVLEAFESRVHIRAPVAGVFTNRRVSPGQAVGAGDVVGEIIDRSHLRIAASLFPLAGIGLEGKAATVRLGENQDLQGVVGRVLPQAGSTGAVVVWIEGRQIDRRLYPGQTVSGTVRVAVRQGALAVPDSAVVYDEQEQPYVFVRQDDGTYERRSVRLGLTQDGWIEVLSGLDKDQSVVVQGAYELFHREFNRQFKVED